MIITKGKKEPLEERRFDEMAVRTILRVEDGFPFTICIMDPETIHKDVPHAHIFEAKKNGKDLGMRLYLFPAMPRSEAEIGDALPLKGKYRPIPEDWKRLIFQWAKLRNKVLPETTNWKVLWSQWVYSVN
jgi:hypothetical protein